MSRRGKVYFRDKLAGSIEEVPEGYRFSYDPDYSRSAEAMPVSLQMPLTQNVYESKTLFAFFDGLIPEGWLLETAINTWKLDSRDRMGLLLTCCQECIGAVGVVEEK